MTPCALECPLPPSLSSWEQPAWARASSATPSRCRYAPSAVTTDSMVESRLHPQVSEKILIHFANSPGIHHMACMHRQRCCSVPQYALQLWRLDVCGSAPVCCCSVRNDLSRFGALTCAVLCPFAHALQVSLPQALGGLAATVFYLDTEGKFSSDVSSLCGLDSSCS
jgi:hypothetical protein